MGTYFFIQNIDRILNWKLLSSCRKMKMAVVMLRIGAIFALLYVAPAALQLRRIFNACNMLKNKCVKYKNYFPLFSSGIKTIILPKANRKDLHELADEVRAEMTFHFVEHVHDVLRIAIPGLTPLAPTQHFEEVPA